MKWEEIRELLPHRWLVVEAVVARTENHRRIVDVMSVVDIFADDWKPAWERYKELHAKDRCREYFIMHTDRVELDIRVRDDFGLILGVNHDGKPEEAEDS